MRGYGGVEKKEPTLRVLSGAGIAAVSSGRDSNTAREADKNPTMVEEDVAALDMVAARGSGGCARVFSREISSGFQPAKLYGKGHFLVNMREVWRNRHGPFKN